MRDVDLVSDPQDDADFRNCGVSVAGELGSLPTSHIRRTAFNGEARLAMPGGVRRSYPDSYAGSGISAGIWGNMGQ